jgi:hypothetical protein
VEEINFEFAQGLKDSDLQQLDGKKVSLISKCIFSIFSVGG